MKHVEGEEKDLENRKGRRTWQPSPDYGYAKFVVGITTSSKPLSTLLELCIWLEPSLCLECSQPKNYQTIISQ